MTTEKITLKSGITIDNDYPIAIGSGLICLDPYPSYEYMFYEEICKTFNIFCTIKIECRGSTGQTISIGA